VKENRQGFWFIRSLMWRAEFHQLGVCAFTSVNRATTTVWIVIGRKQMSQGKEET
jgi:hypothetical protein